MLIAQISDSHLSLPGRGADMAFHSGAHLEAAVRHLSRLARAPDVVIATGDLADGGTAEEYARFHAIVGALPMPLYVVPGNHDHRGAMRAAFGDQGKHAMRDFMQFTVEGGPVRLIALDTHVPEQPTGLLCEARLRWLVERLAEAPGRPTVLFMHHPPFPIGMPAFDEFGLEGADALGEIVARHPNVECLTSGHFHRATQRRFHGAIAMICPSTAFQIALQFGSRASLAASTEPPACLLHTWDARTGLVSHVSPIGDFERVDG